MDGYDARHDQFESGVAAAAPVQADVSAAIGNDERRMHVRAYNYWCSLLAGRDFPSIQDLEASAIADFSTHSVLLDFTGALDNPATPFVGDAIREEIGVDSIQCVTDIPGRSLLSRLTDHHFQIIATRAPVGFEAEFVNQRGHEICYRGILMPFSSDGQDIDFVYGVINWKDSGPASADTTSIRAILPPIVAEREDEQQLLDKLLAEERAHEAMVSDRKKAMALSRAPDEPIVPVEPTAPPHLAWEDGPLSEADATLDISSPIDEFPDIEPLGEDAGLADRLCAARESAEVLKAADGRSRSALYRALAMAYDFAVAARRVPDDYSEILEDAGVKTQARAPMTPIVKLVFGIDYDKARLTEFAAALNYAERCQVDFGQFEDFLKRQDGALKGMVAAERKARRPEPRPDTRGEQARIALRQGQALDLGSVDSDEEFVIVVSRRRIGGGAGYEPVALIDDSKIVERAIRRAAR